MFLLPLLIGAGIVYVFLKPSRTLAIVPNTPSTGAYAANDYAMLPPASDAYAYGYETPLLEMGGSSSAPPPWPPTSEPAQRVQSEAVVRSLGTLYAAQDGTPIRAEPGSSDDQRGTFRVPSGYAMTVLALDPSGWVHVELLHPDHGLVDGWTEIRLLTAIAPAGSASSPGLARPASAPRAASPQQPARPFSAAKAAQNQGAGVPVIDANTGKISGYRPRLNPTKLSKRRTATPVAAGG